MATPLPTPPSTCRNSHPNLAVFPDLDGEDVQAVLDGERGGGLLDDEEEGVRQTGRRYSYSAVACRCVPLVACRCMSLRVVAYRCSTAESRNATLPSSTATQEESEMERLEATLRIMLDAQNQMMQQSHERLQVWLQCRTR